MILFHLHPSASQWFIPPALSEQRSSRGSIFNWLAGAATGRSRDLSVADWQLPVAASGWLAAASGCLSV